MNRPGLGLLFPALEQANDFGTAEYNIFNAFLVMAN